VVPESTLARAQAGDEQAFSELVAGYLRELHLHCYRILGSVADAEDVVQETLLAAWQGLSRYEGRASLRAWLYRIATNRCLNALRDSSRRPQRQPPRPPFNTPEPSREGEPVWLEPIPDDLLDDIADWAREPGAQYEAKETFALAFVAALQHLPPRQRAALLLRDALGFSSAEVAGVLESSEASVNSALQRARAAMAARLPDADRDRAPLPRSARERDLAAKFASAYAADDVDAVVALLTNDAWYTMPPVTLEYQGRDAIGNFLRESSRWRGQRSQRLIPTRANGQPAFACYLYDGQAPIFRAHGLIVLTLEGDQIHAITRFVDSSVLPRFGFPRTLPE
jgi:RNA polymerase sigma-70 factor (TIGR02960 family)